MLGLHKELAEVERPHSEELVFAASDAERLIYCDRVDRGLIRAIGCLKSFCRIINLEYHAVLRCDIDTLQWFIFAAHRIQSSIGLRGMRTPLKIERCEDCIACVVIQNDCWASNIGCLTHTPESDVLLAARNEAVVVNWTELNAQDVKFRSLFRCNLRFFTAVDLRNVPNNDHLLIVVVFAHWGKPLAIRGECNTFEAWDRHCYHRDASACVVVPDSNDWILAFLSWGKHSAMRCYVEAANRSWMTEEEFLLLSSLSVHRN